MSVILPKRPEDVVRFIIRADNPRGLKYEHVVTTDNIAEAVPRVRELCMNIKNRGGTNITVNNLPVPNNLLTLPRNPFIRN